jgi:membrane fusion protein (multidrug efflux system)
MRAATFVLIVGLAFPSAAGALVPQEAPAQSPAEPGGKAETPPAPQKVVVTSPRVTDVVVTQQYASQIRAQRHIELRALTAGVLEAIPVREGQAVKKDDVLFKVRPALSKAKLDAEMAEVKLAQIELDNTTKLFKQNVVTTQEVALCQAKLERAQARAKVAETELDFATVRAPFDGLVGRLEQQEGSLVKEGDVVITSLTDNSVMWVYFHGSETRYLEYKARQGQVQDPSRLELADSRIELQLADDRIFKHDAGNVVTVESTFNNRTGSITFRADFPNPDRLLRHGQTGTVLIRRALKGVTVIPRRAAFEVLDRRFVYVVGKDNVVREREIVVQDEVDDLFVVGKGLDVSEKIVLEGGRQFRDGDKVEYEFRKQEPSRPKGGREQ